MLLRLQIAVVALSLAHSCARHQGPTRLVGLRTESAIAQLGVRPAPWQPASEPGYEVSCASDRVVALYEERASVCLVRRGDTVAAVQFQVGECAGSRYDALREAVIAEFGLSGISDRDVYVVRRNGVIHLRPTADGGATLVVTDGTYGDLYVAEQLRRGFVNLSNGLRPH